MPQTLGPFTALSLPILALPGLARYYRLDETSGTSAVDKASGQTGTYTGGVTLKQNSLVYDEDASALFDGSSGYVNVPTTSLPTGNAVWWAAVWCEVASLPGGNATLFWLGAATGVRTGCWCELHSNGQVVVALANAGGVITSGAVSVGIAHYIVVTWDGTTLTLYIDGVSAGTATPGALALTYVSGGASLAANFNNAAPSQFFPGTLDECAIGSGGVLAAADVANIYAWGLSGLGGAVIEPGRAFPVAIDRAAQAIQVHNDTPYRLYFQLDGPQPIATGSLTGGYMGMAAPWSHPVLPVQRTAASGYERALNAIKDFQGTLWVMVIDPTAALAQTGIISALTEVHVDVYLPGEMWPQSWAIPRQHDLTSEPRMVSIPTPAGACHADKSTVTGIGQIVLTHPPLDIAFQSPWAHKLAFYLHAFSCSLMHNQNAFVEVALQMVQLNNVAAVLHSDDLVHFALSVGPLAAGTISGGANFVYTPASPFAVSFVPQAATVQVALALNVITFQVTSGTPSLLDTWQADVDWQSNGIIPPIGQGTGAISGGRF